MKITKIGKRKNIRKSKKSINNQHGGQPLPLGWAELGWAEHTDPASGKTFYTNAAKGQSQWERPTDTYKQYKSYIEACKEKAYADYYCRKKSDDSKAWGEDGDRAYNYCMYEYKHACKEKYIKKYGPTPSKPFLSRFGF